MTVLKPNAPKKLRLLASVWRAGLPDSFLAQHTKTGKIYQITVEYTKWPQNILNGCKTDQMAVKYTNIFNPPKISQIWIFGLKLCHLATLVEGENPKTKK
jgi:hypothetical protein